jgi:hypothetical protein
MVLSYLHSPAVILLTASEKRDLGMTDVVKLLQLCGGDIPHTFSMLIALDLQNLQSQSVRHLAHDAVKLEPITTDNSAAVLAAAIKAESMDTHRLRMLRWSSRRMRKRRM